MSYNDTSRTFHPGQQQQQQSVPLAQEQQPIQHVQPTPTQTTIAPLAQPAQTTEHSQHHSGAVGGVLPNHHQSAVPVAAAGVPQGGQSQVHDGLYPISAFVLKQGGAYQAHAVVKWTTSDGRSGHTEKLGSSIGFGHTGSRSLKNKGIPDGARVRLTLDVLLGKTSEAKEEFIYDSRALTSAFYQSGGTSLTNDKVHLVVEDGVDKL